MKRLFILILALFALKGVGQDVTGLDGWPTEYLGEAGLIALATVSVDDFTRQEIRGFSVWVEDSLRADMSAGVATMLELIEARLVVLQNGVNSDVFTKLTAVPIWLSDNDCGHTAAWYHRSTGTWWLERNGRPVEMAGGVEFCRVDYVVERNLVSGYLTHELAHGFHERYLTDGFENQSIIDAYDRQWLNMLYYNILKSNGDYDDEGHANSNAVEYFAHLSTKYLGTDGEYPFVNAELRHHDNFGWQIADAAWTNGTLDSTWFTCAQIGQIRSGSGSNRIRLEFVNRTEAVRYMVWIDREGEVGLGVYEWKMDPGETRTVSTRRNHVWALYDENKECLGVFKPGIESEAVEITR